MKQFPGFPPEGQYWQFPTIINGFVNLLSGNEFKVLWYILRHTYGFQKQADYITISQIMNGIKRKDGVIIDKGTGIKHRSTVEMAIKKLEKLGFIEVVSGKKKGKANLYRPVIQKIPYPNNYSTPSPNNYTTPPTLKKRHTINNNTIDNNNIITPLYISPLKKKIYSSLKDIKDQDLEEIAQKYRVSVAFVKLVLEKMTNWLEAKGKRYKNYKRALMNWVLSEAQRLTERRYQDDRKRGIDASNLY